MFETILVPLDGSDLAEAALAPAREIKGKFGSRLVLLRAIEPESHRLTQTPAFFESPAAAVSQVELVEQMMVSDRQEARRYLDTVAESLGTAVESFVVEDAPADAIIALAAEKDASLIVMSSHGRGGIGRLVPGSTADVVMRESKTPVLLLRSGRAADAS